MEGFKAFISYSHADERWARWLHRALETRRLPKTLRAASGIDTLRPIFRDRDELGSASRLDKTLLDALERSASLIVVCSPAAAASAWVEEEVRTFRHLHPQHPVIAVLVDGDAGNAFVPALLHELLPNGELGAASGEPLAIDPRIDGRNVALQKVIAGLLKLPFDQVRQRDRVYRRQRLISGGVVATALAATLSTGTYYLSRPAACLAAATLESELWPPAAQANIERAFLATGMPFAADAWTSIQSTLSQYARAWSALHHEACTTTQRGEQSEAMLDRRMACLVDRRHAFLAVRDELSGVASEDLERTGDLLDLLPRLERCSDTAALEAAYPPPENPQITERVRSLGQELARTRSAIRVSGSDGALAHVSNLVADAEALNYPPVEAAALLVQAEALDRSAEPGAAIDTYFKAATRAVAARDPELAARAWLSSAAAVQNRDGGAETVEQNLDMAASYVEQLPEANPLHGVLMRERGVALIARGDGDTGITILRQSVAFARLHDPEHLPTHLNTLTWALSGEYDLAGAAEAASESAQLVLDRHGAEHPLYAAALRERARVASLRGEHEEAVRYLQAALAILRGSYPPTHRRLLIALNAAAWSEKNLGNWDQAQVLLDEALAGLAAAESAYPRVAGNTHNNYADLYLSQGNYDEAREHLEKAIEIWETADAKQSVAIALNNRGNLANRVGRYDDALQDCEQSLELEEALHGKVYLGIAFPLSCIGEARIGLGDFQGAVATLERAYELRSADPRTHQGALAWTRWLLGRALWQAGKDPTRAREHVVFAYEVFEESEGSASELADIKAWLEEEALDWVPG